MTKIIQGMNMNFRTSLLTYSMAFFLIICSSTLIWAQMPGEVIVQTLDESLKVLQDPDLQDFDRLEERKRKLWMLLEPIFNFEEISKRALGRHWKDRTEEEQNQFTEVFTSMLKDIYLSKSDSYSGEGITYIRETVQGNRSRVQTNFFTTGGDTIAVDFSMRNSNGAWKIYDVSIEGVSMVSNYRSQFNSIILKSSFSELIQKLKEKEEEFADF